MAAIGAGFAYAERQNAHARARDQAERELDDTQTREAARGLLWSTMSRLQSITEILRNKGRQAPGPLIACSFTLQEQARALDSFHVDRLRTPLMIQHFCAFRSVIAGANGLMSGCVKALEAGKKLPPPEWEELASQLVEIQAVAHREMIALEEAMAA